MQRLSASALASILFVANILFALKAYAAWPTRIANEQLISGRLAGNQLVSDQEENKKLMETLKRI